MAVAAAPATTVGHPLNTAVQELYVALSAASSVLSNVPNLVRAFDDAPHSLREDEVDTSLFDPGLWRDLGQTDQEDAPFRNLSVERPALPASTRVKLPPLLYASNRQGRNASTILGYQYFNGNFVMDRRYIATQHPSLHTVNNFLDAFTVVFDTRADFWLVIRSTNTRAIVMLDTWSERRASPYLPLEVGAAVQYYAHVGGVPPAEKEQLMGHQGNWVARTTIRCIEKNQLEQLGLVIRVLEVGLELRVLKEDGITYEVIEDQRKHRVTHYHYLKWPDGSVPFRVSDLFAVIVRAQELLVCDQAAPVAVHCLAGHGRTGTLLAAVMALRMHLPTQTISTSLWNAFTKLRTERYFTVQNSTQVLYSYGCFVMLLASKQKASDQSFLSSAALVANHVRDESAANVPRCVRCLTGIATIGRLHKAYSDDGVINFCSESCSQAFARAS